MLGDDDGRQLALCDMPGIISNMVGEADEFAGHLADERRTEDRSFAADWGFALPNKADAYTGRGVLTFSRQRSTAHTYIQAHKALWNRKKELPRPARLAGSLARPRWSSQATLGVRLRLCSSSSLAAAGALVCRCSKRWREKERDQQRKQG